MRKLGATGMAALLCAGLALSPARADDGDSGDLRSLPAVKPSWWSGMFGNKETAPETKLDAKKVVPAEAAPPPRAPGSAPASLQAREENALFRRLAVCDELVEIADRKGDEALREQAYQLMDKAWAVYQQHTGARTVQRTTDTANLTRPPSAADGNRRAAAEDTAPWNKRGEQP
jgi:hypothetical protein